MREPNDETLQYASPWRRIFGFLIDNLIVALISFPLYIATSNTETFDQYAWAIVTIIVGSIYQISFLSLRGATPGKVAMGVTVVDVTGHAMLPDRAILRYLIYFLGSLVAAGTFISFIMVLADRPQRRSIHDRIAGTRVIRGLPRERQPRDPWS